MFRKRAVATIPIRMQLVAVDNCSNQEVFLTHRVQMENGLLRYYHFTAE